MAYEDLTTFTESDPGGVLTVTASKVLATSIANNFGATTYLVKDYGADYFDALDVDLASSSVIVDSGHGAYDMFCFKNSTTAGGFNALSSTEFGLMMNDDGTNSRVGLMRGSFTAFDSCQMSADNVTAYLTLGRSAGNTEVTLYVYSDSDRTSLVDALVISGVSSTKYRYLWAFDHTNQFGTLRHTAYFENVDLNLAPPETGGQPRMARSEHLRRGLFGSRTF